MKIIEKLSEMIEDELDGAKDYIKFALEQKDEHKALADTLYTISLQEMGHVNLLHEQVTALIMEYRKTNGEPPADMLAVYDYLHKKQIEAANKVKTYQAMYKA